MKTIKIIALVIVIQAALIFAYACGYTAGDKAGSARVLHNAMDVISNIK